MDYHVMKKAADSASCAIAVHLPSPTGKNTGNIPWATALRFGKGGNTAVFRLDKNEVEALNKGTLIEVPQIVTFSNPGLTNAQRRTEIRAVVAQMQTDIVNTDSDLYKEQIGIWEWFGYKEDI